MLEVNNRVVDILTFFQWINVEYAMVRRKYKNAPQNIQEKLKREFEQYKLNCGE